MTGRIEQELELLRQFFPDLVYRGEGHWVLLPRFRVPQEGGWLASEVAVAFQFPAGYPAQKPYGFHVSPPLVLTNSATVRNATPSVEPPWAGPWMKFSWDAPAWRPTQDVERGSNMLNYALTFTDRLKEGA